jgi:hypothetical protein
MTSFTKLEGVYLCYLKCTVVNERKLVVLQMQTELLGSFILVENVHLGPSLRTMFEIV